MSKSAPILVVDRQSGQAFEEAVLGEKWIRWAYQDSKSSLLERLLFRSAFVSRLLGAWYDSPLSKGKIEAVIEELKIDRSEFAEPAAYATFNDFFIRRLKPQARPVDGDPNTLISPADGRVLVFPRLDGGQFAPVKGFPFNLEKMLPEDAARFQGGALAIVRLCPADYHRYHFPCDGRIDKYADYPGALHSVNPIALASGADVFGENKRSLTLLQTERFGTLAYVEVGAFGVGSIVNTVHAGAVRKMDEKGWFKFGGSTVVLVFEPGKIEFSGDLVANSAQGKETLVKLGQALAHVI